MSNDTFTGQLSYKASLDNKQFLTAFKEMQNAARGFNSTIDGEIDGVSEGMQQVIKVAEDLKETISKTTIEEIYTDSAAQKDGANLEKIKKEAKELQDYINSIPFTINNAQDKSLSQSEIDAINESDKARLKQISDARSYYGNTGIPGEQTNTVQTVQSQNALSEALANARRAYSDADEVTKQYLALVEAANAFFGDNELTKRMQDIAFAPSSYLTIYNNVVKPNETLAFDSM